MRYYLYRSLWIPSVFVRHYSIAVDFLRAVHVSQWQCAARRGISKTRNRGSILQLLDDAGGKYNFVYMPAGRSTHAGLAIVNFVDAEACHRCFLALKNMQDLSRGSDESWELVMLSRGTKRYGEPQNESKNIKISLRFFAFGPFSGGFLFPKSRCPSLAPLSQEQGLMVGIKSIGQSKIQGFSEWRVWQFGGNT